MPDLSCAFSSESGFHVNIPDKVILTHLSRQELPCLAHKVQYPTRKALCTGKSLCPVDVLFSIYVKMTLQYVYSLGSSGFLLVLPCWRLKVSRVYFLSRNVVPMGARGPLRFSKLTFLESSWSYLRKVVVKHSLSDVDYNLAWHEADVPKWDGTALSPLRKSGLELAVVTWYHITYEPHVISLGKVMSPLFLDICSTGLPLMGVIVFFVCVLIFYSHLIEMSNTWSTTAVTFPQLPVYPKSVKNESNSSRLSQIMNRPPRG